MLQGTVLCTSSFYHGWTSFSALPSQPVVAAAAEVPLFLLAPHLRRFEDGWLKATVQQVGALRGHRFLRAQLNDIGL